MSSQSGLIKVGTTGKNYGFSGRYFDLKGHNEISQIFVSVRDSGIGSIQFQYVENGKYVLSDQYGSYSGCNHFHTVELNHPAEYITGFNGLYSTANESILAITFTTNVDKYGPFEVSNSILQSRFPDRQAFTYNFGKSFQFGGFHGSCYDSRLVSLGFYLTVKTGTPNIRLKVPKIGG